MYSFGTTMHCSFDDAETKVIAALKEAGFGIITEIDVQATMKAKLDIDKRPYKILGACNPGLANQAIDHDADMGLLLPCNVVVRENENGDIVVAFMDPVAVLSLSDNPAVTELANRVKVMLEGVNAALAP